jgi:polyisoprenoid-binding protein YceI
MLGKENRTMVNTLPQIDTRTIWTIDPMHSQIEFKIKHMMITTLKGQFTGLWGRLVGDLEDLVQSEVTLEIDTASVDTCNEQRDAHLRTADFLDVERYPTITFKSSAIVQESQERFKLIGNLTFHGVTREVVLDARVNGVVKSPFGTEVMGITAETTIHRQDFGMTFNMPLETGGWALGNSVKIEAVKEASSASCAVCRD